MYDLDNLPDKNSLRKVTLSFIIKDGKILLAMKKRGFGAGLWNGYGGKQLPGESITKTAKRETEEEIGIKVKEMKRIGTIYFFFDKMPKDQNWNQQVAVFAIKKWSGRPRESEEMKPEWFDMDSIPFNKMWDDDKYWLPEIINGFIIEATFIFGSKQKVRSFEIKSVGRSRLFE